MATRDTATLEEVVVELRDEKFASRTWETSTPSIWGVISHVSGRKVQSSSISISASRLWRNGLRLRRQVGSPLRLARCPCLRKTTHNGAGCRNARCSVSKGSGGTYMDIYDGPTGYRGLSLDNRKVM